MAYSYSTYTGDGSNRNFAVPFPYLDKAHVIVKLDNVASTAFTWLNASTIQMNTAPGVGVVVRVERQSNRSAPLVDFADGATLTEAELDLSSKQAIYLAQEALDGGGGGGGGGVSLPIEISDVNGLQTSLNGKAATSHTHAISDVTNLQASLDGKAASAHTHIIDNVTGLQAALDGKAASAHTHIIADVTGLQAALDAKAATSHTHAWGDITSGKPTTLSGYGITDAAGLGANTFTATQTLRASGTGANTAPIKFQNGQKMTTPEANALEYDGQYLWLTTNAGARDRLANLADVQGATAGVSSFNSRTGAVTLTSGDVTGALSFTPLNKAGDNMTGTLTPRTGTAGANTAPIKFNTGVLNSTPEAGALEYDGTHLYLTTSGGSRERFLKLSEAGGSGVTTFNTRSGAVTLTSTDVTNALGFTPAQATHTHAISDITNLQTTLNGKAATGANTDITSVVLNYNGLVTRDSDNLQTWTIRPGTNLTANRIFTVTTGDADRILDMSVGNLTFTTIGKSVVEAADAAGVRTAISAAASGTNTDINSVFLTQTGLKLKSANASFGLTIVPNESLTADRTLNIVTGNANRTLNLSVGDLVFTSVGKQLAEATDAAAARTAISAAASSDLASKANSGANTDISSVFLNQTGLKLKSANASFGLTLRPNESLTADRTLNVITGNADRTLDLTIGNIAFTSTGKSLAEATSAANGRSTLGAAASGANTDITSLFLDQTGLKIKSGNGSFGLIIRDQETLTADRMFNIITGNAERTLDLTIGSLAPTSIGKSVVEAADAAAVRTAIVAAGTGVANTFTATQTLRASSTAAGTAPIKFQAGSIMTTPEAHAMEWDGTHLYVTTSAGSRERFAKASEIGGSGVTTFNTRSGAVTLTSTDVTNALGFTPAQATHSHAISDITNLQTELNGKAASSHSHSWADITSGKPTTLAGYGITDATGTGANTFTGTQTLRAGATGAGTAPLKFQAGSLMTTPENHALEWDGTDISTTTSAGVRRKLLKTGRQTMWIPAPSMGASGTAAALSAITTGAGHYQQSRNFDSATKESAFFTVAFPKSWDKGAVRYKVFWRPASASSGDCRFLLAGNAFADGDDNNPTLGTEVLVTDTAATSSNNTRVSAESGDVTIAGSPLDDEMVLFRFSRDAANAGDTMAGDAAVFGIQLFYNVTASTDD